MWKHYKENDHKIQTKPEGDTATIIVTVMKCKAAFSALGVLLENNVLGYPQFWVCHVTCLDQSRTRNK